MPLPASPPIRVVIVDDHIAIRESLSAVLGSEPDLVVSGAVATAAEAPALIEDTRPDVAIIDISLEDASGLDLVERLHADHPHVGLLVFSMYDETVYAERALRLGASAYLMKRSAAAVVADAVRAVAKGQIYVSHRVAARMLARYIQPTGFAFELDTLTEREQTVLRMLGDGHGVVDIAAALGLQTLTVEQYRQRVKDKLGFETVSDLLQFAVERSSRAGAEPAAE